ncbi:MAG: hypothetical protein AB7G06_02635 [Bdellovibrionales bacterium]
MLRKALFFIALIACYAASIEPAQALFNPNCQVGNRNWYCAPGTTPPSGGPITVCIETVKNGVVTDRRDITFANATAMDIFLDSAPANTSYEPCGTTPSCTQSTQTRTQQCPTGQTGIITEQRTICVGGNPTVTTEWTEISRTCSSVCTPSTEQRTLACPAGQVGVGIIEQRTVYSGISCPAPTPWTEITRACEGCQSFEETRTRSCPAGYTGTIIDRRTLNVNGYCGQNSNWVEISNTCTQTCTEICTTETTPCGTGYTGNQTRIVTQNTGGVCGNTTYGQWDRSQCVQTCTPGSETRTRQCPAGYTGIITDQRTTNVGGVCGVYGSWTEISNTCTQVCTPGTETRNRSCPAGYTGTIIDTRTTNVGGVCGVYGSWTETTNTCTQTCTPGYESRTRSCPAGYTGTIIDRRTTNVGGVCGTYGSWTEYSNTCVQVCTETTTTETASCGAGYVGTKTRTVTTNTGGVCGNTTYGNWDDSQCRPVIVDCDYCTDKNAQIGLEFNKNDPNYIDIVLIASSNNGLMGKSCTKVDPIHGRRLVARIPLGATGQNFTISVDLRAKVSGGSCTTTGMLVNGYKPLTLTLNVNKSESSNNYLNYLNVGNQTQSGAVAANTMFTNPNSVTAAYANMNTDGLFAQCSGASVPHYNVLYYGHSVN